MILSNHDFVSSFSEPSLGQTPALTRSNRSQTPVKVLVKVQSSRSQTPVKVGQGRSNQVKLSQTRSPKKILCLQNPISGQELPSPRPALLVAPLRNRTQSD
jgi:hypothetical protein